MNIKCNFHFAGAYLSNPPLYKDPQSTMNIQHPPESHFWNIWTNMTKYLIDNYLIDIEKNQMKIIGPRYFINPAFLLGVMICNNSFIYKKDRYIVYFSELYILLLLVFLILVRSINQYTCTIKSLLSGSFNKCIP